MATIIQGRVVIPGQAAGWALVADEPLSFWGSLLFPLLGFVLLVGTLHLARGIGWLHGALAKALLVRAFAARESAPEPAATPAPAH